MFIYLLGQSITVNTNQILKIVKIGDKMPRVPCVMNLIMICATAYLSLIKAGAGHHNQL